MFFAAEKVLQLLLLVGQHEDDATEPVLGGDEIRQIVDK